MNNFPYARFSYNIYLRPDRHNVIAKCTSCKARSIYKIKDDESVFKLHKLSNFHTHSTSKFIRKETTTDKIIDYISTLPETIPQKIQHQLAKESFQCSKRLIQYAQQKISAEKFLKF